MSRICQFAETRNDGYYCRGTKEIDPCPCYANPYSKACYHTIKQKCIWFYDSLTGPVDRGVTVCYKSWSATEQAVMSDDTEIHTYQMGYLINSALLFEKGYRIFIYDDYGEFEITLGDCARTNREIRKGHNIFKMWVSGEFTNYDKR
jgi:hypothetical protein